MLIKYFLKYFEMVPVAPIITGVTFVFTFHMRCISITRSSYFRIFSASLSHSCLPGLLRQLLCMFLFHYPGLCLVYCWGWFCRSELVDSIIWLPCPLDLFLQIYYYYYSTRFECMCSIH
jgi:hypothetical protein